MEKQKLLSYIVVLTALGMLSVVNLGSTAMADRNQQPYGELVSDSAKNPEENTGEKNFGQFRSGFEPGELGPLIKSEKGNVHNIHDHDN
jgi:hypothetical protein